MGKIRPLGARCLTLGILSLLCGTASAFTLEFNPVTSHPVAIGPQADRIIVGFKANAANVVTKTIKWRSHGQAVKFQQAQTSAADAVALSQRSSVATAGARQITPSMHVLLLPKTLYGNEVAAALERLRADPAVAFADVDERRYPHALPDDPLFVPVIGSSSGQWYLQPPSSATPTSDAAATDAVSAWDITKGSTGTVIADVDSGIRFDHPDLLRAGFGGRLLPGYDFVGQDYNASTSAALGTYLVANDGDAYDPDPADPGDWINSTDLLNTALFPSANCSVEDSTWHGTRVVGVLGALTNNGVGVAGMTWVPYILPVRALGKCGGYDSDIIAGIEWSVGLSVNGVPDNPYPADIVNLSLGGSGACPSDYQSAITTLSSMGVLVVASAGNESGPVDAPGNCAGVLTVAGLRNIGTKVGYSSLGAEVGIAAPAGNCVNSSGACLRSIDTTTNTGLTVPVSNTYTNQTNPNLGTSFSAPIVSGIAALMRSVNANLTPAQLISRIESSATAFPQPAGLAVCPAVASDGSGECACTVGQCGAGMVNALHAVKAAQRPIAAVTLPANYVSGSGSFNAGASVAACGLTVSSYAWSSTGAVVITAGAATAQVTVTASGTGTLTVVVTDSVGNTDSAVIHFSSSGAMTTAPTAPGTPASACLADFTFTLAAPTVTESFQPSSVAVNTATTLTLTMVNSNPFALTQASLNKPLPANLEIAAAPAPSTTCSGAARQLTSTTNSIALSNANIPANGSCSVTVSVKSATVATYTDMVAASALSTGPAGGNAASGVATLDVTAPSKSGGGGDWDWWDGLFVVGVLLAGRRYRKRAV